MTIWSWTYVYGVKRCNANNFSLQDAKFMRYMCSYSCTTLMMTMAPHGCVCEYERLKKIPTKRLIDKSDIEEERERQSEQENE